MLIEARGSVFFGFVHLFQPLFGKLPKGAAAHRQAQQQPRDIDPGANAKMGVQPPAAG
jgi:hypothetical protein